MHKIFLIIQREYLTRVKKRSFILMTILGPLLMAGLFIGTIWLGTGVEENQRVLIVDDSKMFDQLPNSEKVQFYYSNMRLDEAKQAFHASDYTSIVYVSEDPFATHAVDLFYKKQPGFSSFKYIENTLEERLEHYKIIRFKQMVKSEFLEDFFKDIKTNLSVKAISFKEPGKEEKSSGEAGYVGFIFSIAIYFFILYYGVQVMRGVMEEKSNRIVEVIISSVKPFQLMMGKITGIALVSLTQFLMWVVLTTIIIAGAQHFFFKEKFSAKEFSKTQVTAQIAQQYQQSNSEDVSSEKVAEIISRINFPYMIGMFLFYFIGGYLLYGAMFAAIGSAIDSESDNQQFMLPVTLPLVFGFIAAQTAMYNPESPLAVWASIIPLTSPIVMMVRIATVPFGDLALHLFLSMVLLVGGFILTTWMAGKIYRTGILMHGKKVNYKELWKWISLKN